MSRNPIVIVGSGLAGYAVVRELRKLDDEIPITLISADFASFYSKPMLSNALSTGKTPATFLSMDAVKMAEQHKITILPRTRVAAIESANNELQLENGEKLRYDQLVLALGADPIRLPLEGDGASDVLSINDVEDYRCFREALEGKKQISILGAGLIGCEFANDLVAAGYEVHVVDISAEPLGRLLPPAGGVYMRERLEAIGVNFHLDAVTERVERDGSQSKLMLANGETIKSDIILSAVGLAPRTELAAAAGIQINRGIVVNQLLQTQCVNIYALGDCAEVEGKVLPFVMPISHAGRALAATLAGNSTPVYYPAMPVMVKTPACPAVVSPPDFAKKGEWQVEVDQDGVKALFQDAEGSLLGFALLGVATKEKAALTAQLPPILD